MELKINLFVVLFIGFYEFTTCVPTLEVDAKTGRHPISPDIYGINLVYQPEFMKEIKLPVNRFGGNAVTRYNWKINTYNAAQDWYFENKDQEDTFGSSDVFTERNKKADVNTLMCIGMIGWMPKDKTSCSFSVKKYGAQEKIDTGAKSDCGNGFKNDGKKNGSDPGTRITGNDPLDSMMAVNVSFAEEYVQHLVKTHGTASKGGIKFYNLDNEVDIWDNTHRDVRQKPLGTDEILKLSEEYSLAIKKIDPDAKVMGPVGWSYMSILKSGTDQRDPTYQDNDRKAHGNIDYGEYYLKTFKALEDKHKKRLLDYFDCHYYPQSGDSWDPKNDSTINALRFRTTKSLYDPTYEDESWFKDLGATRKVVQFIPRVKKMIAENYPGTKTAITEYYFAPAEKLIGALVQAEVLAIFGREGLDLATLWMYGGDPKLPWAYAFRMFRNYDGKGSEFGDTSVTAKSSDVDKISIFASVRSSDKALIVLVINKESSEVINTKVSISGFEHKGTAKTYTYSDTNLNKIVESKATVSGDSLSHKFPAYSMTLFEIAAK